MVLPSAPRSPGLDPKMSLEAKRAAEENALVKVLLKTTGGLLLDIVTSKKKGSES